MVKNILGTGTQFYGQEKTGQKNAYIATKWIVLFYIPIAPIGSFQVQPIEENENGAPALSQQSVEKKVPLQVMHVCNVYAFILAIGIMIFLYRRTVSDLSPYHANLTSPAQRSEPPPKVPSATEPPAPLIPEKPPYERSATDSNGVPFPKETGYLAGYEHKFWGGNSLTVDHSANAYDIHLKLYKVDVEPHQTASVAFIKGKDKLYMSSLAAGEYDLRYRNLDTGQLFRTDPFTLKEDFVAEDGKYYTGTSLTMIFDKAIDGDIRHYPISEEDFQ